MRAGPLPGKTGGSPADFHAVSASPQGPAGLTGKQDLSGARGVAGGAGSGSAGDLARGSGGGGEGDGVAECFELADVVAGLAASVDAAGVVAGAQVGEAGGGVGQQVPDDHEDRAGHGNEGLELADPPGRPP